MKKRIIYRFILIVLLALCIPMNSLAYSTFKLQFENGHEAKAGETVEIPILISDINMDVRQRGILNFTCKIGYDESIFEPVEDESFIQIEETLQELTKMEYNKQNKILVVTLNPNFFANIANSLTTYTKLGTVKFKVKEDAQPGDYEIVIKDIIGENEEVAAIGAGQPVKVHIFEEKTENEISINAISNAMGPEKNIENNSKEAILDIQVSKDGRNLTIIPDEVNGAKIGKVVINDEEIIRNGDFYEMTTIPGEKYIINVYGEDGAFLSMQTVYTFVTQIEENQDNIEENNQEKTEEKVNNNGSTTQKDENKKTGVAGIIGTNLKTGDYVLIAVGIIVISLLTLFVVRTIIKMKNEDQ